MEPRPGAAYRGGVTSRSEVRRELWHDRGFVILLTARTLSMLALAFAPVALAFGVLDLPGATASTLSSVLAAEAVALVLFTLLGGVVADRYPRDRVLQVSAFVTAVVHAVLGLMLRTGHATLLGLLTVAFVAGASDALVWPAMTGIVPQVVPAAGLQEGNALIGLGGNLARILGLVAGGIVVVAIGGGWALIAAGVTFAVSGLLVALLRLTPATDPDDRPSPLAELRAGWVEFRSRSWLWACVVQFSLLVMVWQAAHLVLGPVVALRDLGGAGTWTTVLTVESVGLVVGGLTAMRWQPQRPILAVVLLSFLAAPPYLLLGARAPLPAVLAGSFGLGFAFELLTVIWQTTMQREIPPESLSRVSSYDALGSLLLGPLGLVLAGPAADHLGARPSLIACGVVMIVVSAAVLLVPGVRELRSRATEPGGISAPDSPAEVGPAVSLPN